MSNVAVIPSARESSQEIMPYEGPFSSPDAFGKSMAMARALASSPLVPKEYRGDEHLGSVLIALDMASRLNANPLMVMQNLHIIEGRPSWSAQFLIATINTSRRFSPLRFVFSDMGPEVEREVITGYDWDNSGPRGRKIARKGTVTYRQRTCYATCRDLRSGDTLDGPVISMDMAADEGWLGKPGSKWRTMPDVMLRYRAASFWTRAYSPETAMGIPTADEVGDIIDVTPGDDGTYTRETTAPTSAADLNASLASSAKHAATPTAEDSSDVPEWPQANADGELVDMRGIPWIEAAHSANKTCNTDGTWRMKRGADPERVAALEAKAMAVPADAPVEPEAQAETDEHEFEKIRRGISDAPDQQTIDEWIDYSRLVVISQSQRFALEAEADERARQLAQ